MGRVRRDAKSSAALRNKRWAEEREPADRVARVWSAALEAWGDAADAEAFLLRPHLTLRGLTPLDAALADADGERRVLVLLRRPRSGAP